MCSCTFWEDHFVLLGFLAVLYHWALIILFSQTFLSLMLSFPIFFLSIFSCLLRTKACSCCLTVCSELAKGLTDPFFDSYFIQITGEVEFWSYCLIIAEGEILPLRCKEACHQALDESENLLLKESLPFVKTWFLAFQLTIFLYFLVH